MLVTGYPNQTWSKKCKIHQEYKTAPALRQRHPRWNALCHVAFPPEQVSVSRVDFGKATDAEPMELCLRVMDAGGLRGDRMVGEARVTLTENRGCGTFRLLGGGYATLSFRWSIPERLQLEEPREGPSAAEAAFERAVSFWARQDLSTSTGITHAKLELAALLATESATEILVWKESGVSLKCFDSMFFLYSLKHESKIESALFFLPKECPIPDFFLSLTKFLPKKHLWGPKRPECSWTWMNWSSKLPCCLATHFSAKGWWIIKKRCNYFLLCMGLGNLVCLLLFVGCDLFFFGWVSQIWLSVRLQQPRLKFEAPSVAEKSLQYLSPERKISPQWSIDDIKKDIFFVPLGVDDWEIHPFGKMFPHLDKLRCSGQWKMLLEVPQVSKERYRSSVHISITWWMSWMVNIFHIAIFFFAQKSSWKRVGIDDSIVYDRRWTSKLTIFTIRWGIFANRRCSLWCSLGPPKTGRHQDGSTSTWETWLNKLCNLGPLLSPWLTLNSGNYIFSRKIQVQTALLHALMVRNGWVRPGCPVSFPSLKLFPGSWWVGWWPSLKVSPVPQWLGSKRDSRCWSAKCRLGGKMLWIWGWFFLGSSEVHQISGDVSQRLKFWIRFNEWVIFVEGVLIKIVHTMILYLGSLRWCRFAFLWSGQNLLVLTRRQSFPDDGAVGALGSLYTSCR